MDGKCPGMDRGNWTSRDIKEHPCPKCGRTIEFWKDDIKRICKHCRSVIFNPSLGDTCLAWCEKAVECIGNMAVEEWKKAHKGGTAVPARAKARRDKPQKKSPRSKTC